MLASIVIPAYRARETIARAVGSALGQSLVDLEAIVVDDGSDDGTAEAAVAAAQGDGRFRLVRLASNRGPSIARNAGLATARGEWIAVLDADDSFRHDRLQKLIAQAQARRSDMLADNVWVRWADGRRNDHVAFPPSRMKRRSAISPAAFVGADKPRRGLRSAGYMKPIVRRAFLTDHAVSYQERFRLCEDFHFYVQCLLRGAVLHYTDDAGYLYTVRSGSLSSAKHESIQAAQLASCRDLREEAAANGQVALAAALERRSRDIELWGQYLHVRRALQRRSPVAAVRTFRDMSSKRYALERIAEKAVMTLLRAR